LAADTSPYDRLWLDYQRTGDERVKAELVETFRPTLVAMAEKVRLAMGGRPVLNDLVNAGTIGLLEAFDRFDPARGVYFETYCTWRVIGAMHDDQRKFDWAAGAIRLKAQRLRAVSDELTAALGHPPSDDALCEALGLSHAELTEVRRHAGRPASLDQGRPDAAGGPGAPLPADQALADHRLDPERLALAREARALLLDALADLPDKQRYVMLLYYFEKLKMADIGHVLEVSEARVSQLHREALDTLLRRLGPRRDDFLDALGA
jgi:RNA polymerase sigma factor for flagellar operon FliA